MLKTFGNGSEAGLRRAMDSLRALRHKLLLERLLSPEAVRRGLLGVMRVVAAL